MIRLIMQVDRRDSRYHGSLTRASDELRLSFTGVLELIAALDRLTSAEHGRTQPDPGERNHEVHDA